MPEADEVLLDALARKVLEGEEPSPGELLGAARERDEAAFGKFWTARTVGTRLASYGINVVRSHGRRRIKASLKDLRRIQLHYNIDLGVDPDADPRGRPSPQRRPQFRDC